jgi:hypothetical protein
VIPAIAVAGGTAALAVRISIGYLAGNANGGRLRDHAAIAVENAVIQIGLEDPKQIVAVDAESRVLVDAIVESDVEKHTFQEGPFPTGNGHAKRTRCRVVPLLNVFGPRVSPVVSE